jgi:dihydrolipoamide dehydrogenase
LPESIYDVAIIGSGPAGYTAAIRAGQLGLKTALIEKDGFLGGTCLHVGCIPTKALLFNAEIWDRLKDAKEFGIEGVGSRKLNWAAIQERKSRIVTKHAKGLEFLMRKNKVETIKGYGKVTGPAQSGVLTIEVDTAGKTSPVKARHVILATGSEARMLPGQHRNTWAKGDSQVTGDSRRGSCRCGVRVDLPFVRLRGDDPRDAAAPGSG